MRFLVATIAAVCAFAFGVEARQFQSALFSAEAPSEMMLQDMFTSFMKQYGKTYSHDQFSARYNQFKSNIEVVRLHNTQANASYTMGLNEFADLSFDEFKNKYFGLNHIEREYQRSQNYHSAVDAAPTAVDWRTSNAVTAIKDQGQCGSCWAFSTTGSIEGAVAIKTGNLISVSEQQLVDCSTAEGNQGCNGGLMDDAFEYVISNGGICSEASYPYTAADGTCKSCSVVSKIAKYVDVAQDDETALQAAVAQQPVSVAVEADQSGFQFYSSGIFSGTCGTNLDHGVLAVGYGSDNGVDYWLVKNSWGASWGLSGYIKLVRNNGQSTGQCGIAMQPSYPIAA